MSDQELYEVARERIDKRNRRWTLWSINLAVLIALVGVMILLLDTPMMLAALALIIAWAGVFTMHTIVLGMGESRDNDIEKEVAKLRRAVHEKPKRLQLAEDGELEEVDEDAAMRQSQKA